MSRKFTNFKHILHIQLSLVFCQNSYDFTDESTPLSKFLYEYYDDFSVKLNTRLPLKLKHGGSNLLVHFLNHAELEKVVEHGCWCKFLGENEDFNNLPDMKIKPVDQLDRICKNWFVH